MKKPHLSSIIVGTLFVSVVFVSCKKNDAPAGDQDASIPPTTARAETYLPQYTGNVIQAYYRGNPVSLLEIENGMYLLGGDVVLKREDIQLPGETITESTVNGTAWPNNTVYYRFNPGISLKLRDTTWPAAIRMWTNAGLGLQFIHDSTSAQNRHIVLSENTEGRAYATSIGAPAGSMTISIDLRSFGTGNLAHEIGHALGLEHEQTRHDRDLFVNVNTSGLTPDWAYQYNVKSAAIPVGPFDFGSIMLYPSSANRLTRLDGSGWPYNRSNLTATDILGIRYKYNITTYTANGTYELITQFSSRRALHADSLQNVVYADTVRGTEAQRWRVRHQSNGFYKLTAWRDSSLCLARTDTSVVLQSYTGTNNQLWAIVPAYINNHLRLVSKNGSRLCVSLDTAGVGAARPNITPKAFRIDSTQQWELRPVQ